MHKIKAIVVLFVALLPLDVIAQDCPPIASPPPLTAAGLAFKKAWQSVAEPYVLRHAVKNSDKAYYGVGYLRVLNANNYFYDWPKNTTLPLWQAPDNKSFYGWLNAGRVYPGNKVKPYVLTGIGMVETEYEHNSFIVQQALGNGWLKIKLRPKGNTEIWTHQCHLAIGKVKLAYETWEVFLKKHGDWLHFRARVPHFLREQPDVNSPRITKIGIDHKLILQEFKGDWMRVKVQQPDLSCSGLPEENFKVSRHEGWVKWRDDNVGPWVWVYTRGC